MGKIHFSKWLFCSIGLASGLMFGQSPALQNPVSELRLHLVPSQAGKQQSAPAVAWLDTLAVKPDLSFPPHGRYTLLQKNRTFVPHLQIIPVGAAIQFPNSDPFFHNVFSLFNGKRFDLGLYEAGSSKSVTFSREGVSYIFCNIHPEMSAVVIALSTPLYAVADAKDAFVLSGIPAGDYSLHLWIEGVPQAITDRLTRPVHLLGQNLDLGPITVPVAPQGIDAHTNKFGNLYDPSAKSPYDH